MAKARSSQSAGKAKQRIVGATVLVAIFVIIVLILPSQNQEETEVLQAVEIPPKPENLNVKVLPIEIPQPPREPKPVKPIASIEPVPTSPPETSDSPETEVAPEPPVDTASTEKIAAVEETPSPAVSAKQAEQWVIQVGSFSSRENAEQLRDRLKADNYKVFVQEVSANGSSSFRVNVGPNPDRSKLEPFKAKLEKLLNASAIIKAYEP